MVAGLQKIDVLVADPVHETVPSSDPAGPDIRTQMLQGLGLPDAIEWVAPCFLHQFEDAKRDSLIRGYPVRDVFHALVLDDRDPLGP